MAVLADDPSGQLGQLVVSQNQVDPLGILALECRDQIDQPVRAVGPVVVVLVDLMDEFLQDEVPPGMPVQRRDRQRLAERRQVPVQIADHHDLVGIIQRDDRARAPGGRGASSSVALRMVARIFWGSGMEVICAARGRVRFSDLARTPGSCGLRD